jgi:hypothetical protein
MVNNFIRDVYELPYLDEKAKLANVAAAIM